MKKSSARLVRVRDSASASRLLPEIHWSELAVVDRLAAGGTSSVYEVERLRDGRRFALKVLRREEIDLRLRFVVEARALARVRHPNAVGIVGEVRSPGGRPCILMPLLRGETLRSRLDTCGALAEVRAIDLMIDVLAGLDAAHAVGILHRDLAPRNVFIGQGAEEPASACRALVLDFGLAKLTMTAPPTDLSRQHPARGNPAYMAPEQILGLRTDARTDVYAVAAVLFEMIAGRPPFASSDPDEVMKAHLERRAPRLDRVANASAGIADVVARALEKHPGARFAGARALSDALVAARGHATRSLGVPL